MLLERLDAEFYVPLESARIAVEERTSFNAILVEEALKVDFFVLGPAPLDRWQLERRVPVDLPGRRRAVWTTSAEVLVLRKLDWFRLGGSVSDRQLNDVVGILRVQSGALDEEFLESAADVLDLSDLLESARSRASAP